MDLAERERGAEPVEHLLRSAAFLVQADDVLDTDSGALDARLAPTDLRIFSIFCRFDGNRFIRLGRGE